MSINTTTNRVTVKVENRRKINVGVYKNHETTPTRNLSPGEQVMFSTSTASVRDSETITIPQLESLQLQSSGFVYNPRCDIRYQDNGSSNDSPLQMREFETQEADLPKGEEGNQNPEPQKPVTVTLGQDEPPTTLMSCQFMSKVLLGSSVGFAAAPFIYNASTLAWGGVLAASVIGGIVTLFISRAKQK